MKYAEAACPSNGHTVSDHLAHSSEMITVRKGARWEVWRGFGGILEVGGIEELSMDKYPPHIYAALGSMGLAREEDIEAYLRAFIAAWGSLELPGLLRALREGGEFNRLFAIWALATTRTTEAHDALLPLLESVQPLERWASALSLGEQYREARALPTLRRMLGEMLPPHIEARMIQLANREYRAADYYSMWRAGIPTLLGEYGGAASVPALRTGLQAALQVELALVNAHSEARPPERDEVLADLHMWTTYEDRIVYALGRLGGFGALTGIVGAETTLAVWPGFHVAVSPQSHLDHWRVHLIMGSLHGQYRLGMIWEWAQIPELLQVVTRQLEQVFGLEPEVYTPALERYALDMSFILAGIYGWDRSE